MGSTILVDQSMAAMLGSGSVAALNYANKLTSLLLSIGVSSLATAVLPSFSRLSANQDWAGLRRVLNTYTNLIALATVPLTVVLIIFSEPLIATFFQGGAFTAQDAHLIARVQSLLFLQLPFYATGILYVTRDFFTAAQPDPYVGNDHFHFAQHRAESPLHEDTRPARHCAFHQWCLPGRVLLSSVHADAYAQGARGDRGESRLRYGFCRLSRLRGQRCESHSEFKIEIPV